MKKLPIFIISICILLVLSAKAVHASTSFFISAPSSANTGGNIDITIGASSDTQNNSYQFTIMSTGNITIDAHSQTTNSTVCNLLGFARTSNQLICGVNSPGWTGPRTTFFTIHASAGANGQATVYLNPVSDHTNNNATYAANNGIADSINTFGGSATIAIGTGVETPTPTITFTPTQSNGGNTTPTTTTAGTTATPTQHVLATPVNPGQPGSFNAKPTVKPTITTANQPTLVVVTQPPITLPKQNTTTQNTVEKVAVTPSTQSLQTLVQAYFSNGFAALLFIFPILLLLLIVAFMSFRMYQMGRRRQREVELLFEHELGKLAALESKMDIINEKGDKGKQEFREEFERTKDQILKEIRPDYIGNEASK